MFGSGTSRNNCIMLACRCIVFALFAILVATDVWSASTRRPRSTKTSTKKMSRTATTLKPQTTKKAVKTDSSNPFCRNYNRIKKNLFETAFQDDFISGKRDAVTELLDPRDRAFGSFNKQGFRLYFDSLEKVGFKRAVEACMYRKLELLAIDTVEEVNHPYFSANFSEGDAMHFNDTDADMEFVWTSAAPCSKSDPLNKATNSCSSVTWCSNNLESKLNYTLNLGQISPPYCLVFKRSTQQLVPTKCSFEAFFLCELACSKPQCPRAEECKKDDSLFEVIDGKTYMKKKSQIRGKWERSKYNISYFVGEKLVTWSENWKTCCSLGLKPIALTDFIVHFDRRRSPMQGVVYWTAMTRAGCPYQFENCLHNVSEPFSLSINGMYKGGSCVAVSVRDPSTAVALNNVGLAAKVTVCNSKLLLGCEGPEETFEVREEEPNNCKLPQCTGLPACVMDDSNFIVRPLRALFSPQRFGLWNTECQHNMIELQHEAGTWDEAYKRCCSFGMDLISIQNPNRQNCMDKPTEKTFRFYSGQFWTSGRDIESCRGQLRWCTGYLNDYLKKDLYWKKGTNVKSANNSCVYIDYDDPQVPSLGLADCSEKKKILCEGPSTLDFRSSVFFPFCRDTFRVKKSEAQKLLETGDFSRAGYASKKMIQCIAEYLGLVYNSTEINERVYLLMMAKMSFPIDTVALKRVISDKREWLLTFQKAQGLRKIVNFLSDMINDVLDEFYSSNFQLAADMISKLYECRHIAKTNDDTFAFDFLQCLLQSKGLDRFWNAYNVEFDPYTVMPVGFEFNTSCLMFGGRLLNSSFCIPPDILISLTDNEQGPFFTGKPISVSRFKTSSYTACLERRGSLPYVDTKEEFDAIYSFFRSVAPNLTIIWDLAVPKSDGGFMWCRSDFNPYFPEYRSAVPVSVNATTLREPLLLVSLPGPVPNLHAVPVTDELKYQTDVFCRFPPEVVMECMTDSSAQIWEY